MHHGRQITESESETEGATKSESQQRDAAEERCRSREECAETEEVDLVYARAAVWIRLWPNQITQGKSAEKSWRSRRRKKRRNSENWTMLSRLRQGMLRAERASSARLLPSRTTSFCFTLRRGPMIMELALSFHLTSSKYSVGIPKHP